MLVSYRKRRISQRKTTISMHISILTIGIITLLELSNIPAKPTTYKHDDYEWCRYQIFDSARPWIEAKAACEAVGKTLVQITNANQHSFLTSLIKTSATLLTRPQKSIASSLWIGLHVDAAGNKRWENCDPYKIAGAYDPIMNNHGDGCFVLDIKDADNQFSTDACQERKQFICGQEAKDNCYKAAVVVGAPFMETMQGDVDCASAEALYYSCSSECVALKSEDGQDTCSLYTAHAQGGRPNETFHSKELLYYEDIQVTATVSAQQLCSVAVEESTPAPVEESTPAPLEESTPAPVEESTPAPVEESTPAPVESSFFEASFSSSSIGNVPQHSSTVTPELTSIPSAINTSPITPVTTSDVCEMSSVYSANNYQSDTVCHCACENGTNTSISNEELAKKLKELREELIIKKDDLSSWKRKLISVPDDRTSAKNIGYVGVIVLGSVLFAILLVDVPRTIMGIKRLLQALRPVKSNNKSSTFTRKRRYNESNC